MYVNRQKFSFVELIRVSRCYREKMTFFPLLIKNGFVFKTLLLLEPALVSLQAIFFPLMIK